MKLDRTDLTAIRSALQFALRILASRNENTTAFDNALTAIEAALANATRVSDLGDPIAADGNPKTAVGHNELHDWVTVAEAARLLDCSERRVRQIAPAVGGRKRGGTWWIPKSALPED